MSNPGYPLTKSGFDTPARQCYNIPTRRAASGRELMVASNIENAEEMLTAKPIRTVFFDFDGTLVFHEPDSFDVISAFCTRIGQPLSAEVDRRGRRTRHKYFVDPIIRDHLEGLSSGEFWQHFNRHLLEAICVEGDLDRLAEEVTSSFAELDLTHHCPQAGCHTLSQLRARGYGLGLITNRKKVERFHELLDQMELWPYFDLILASGEVSASKPDPRIFYSALERLGARAEASLYVGDNYWADVLGAQRAGMTPVLFDPHHLFPEANCLTLERIDHLLQWLP
jgi:FMN phosphatase YigB (HAD superfamily)